MNNANNSPQAGGEKVGRIAGDELKAELVAVIENGDVIGALLGNKQAGVKLVTAAGEWQVFGSNIIVLSLGSPLSDNDPPSVRWIAAE